MLKCPCCSNKHYEECCGPLIDAIANADSPEKLMRSRFSAYKLKNYQYVLDTYGATQQKTLSLEQLSESASGAHWLGLEVIDSTEPGVDLGQVEFIAYYVESKQLHKMHEISAFERQDGKWKYTTGKIQPDSGKLKLSRNAPCPCQSGKKLKQCCLSLIA